MEAELTKVSNSVAGQTYEATASVSDCTILLKEFYRINLGFKSPQTLFGSSGREERNSSQKRARGGPSLAEWAPKRLLQFGSGKQMLVKLVMPEISGDDAAQKWMWWQRLGFFKPKRLMQFGKFINTGEIGYNLCLQQLSIVDDAAAYQARRLRTPLCFCVQSYIRISVNTNLE